jgi:hypothetical protein
MNRLEAAGLSRKVTLSQRPCSKSAKEKNTGCHQGLKGIGADEANLLPASKNGLAVLFSPEQGKQAASNLFPRLHSEKDQSGEKAVSTE